MSMMVFSMVGRSEGFVENDDSGQTYKLSLNYRADDSTSFYGTFSQGFRLGGPHPEIPSDICDTAGVPDQIDSDELDSFEAWGKVCLRRWACDAQCVCFPS